MIYVAFECGSEDRLMPVPRHLEWVQITYNTIRAEVDGVELDLAAMSEKNCWYVTGEFVRVFGVGDPNELWSDIVIG